MRVFFLYEGRRRDNAVDARWNIDETMTSALPRRSLGESPWAADLEREFYAVILREWVRLGFIEEAVLVAIPSKDPASRRYAPFGVYDLGGGVSACLIPSAAALNATFPAGDDDLLWVRGPYAYWDNVRESRSWSKIVYYSANGKALKPAYRVDAVLVDHPEMAVDGVPSVLFEKTCDTRLFRPLRLEKTFDVLVPGAISGKKGQLALARLLPPELDVVFAGDLIDLKTGRERPEVAEIRRVLPRARLVGHVGPEELNRLYNEARVTAVYSSSDDPAPRVLLESIAAGTPVVMPSDMRFSSRYAAPGAIETAPRFGPLFRRALRKAKGDAAAVFAERHAPGLVAERVWQGLQRALRRPARVSISDGAVLVDGKPYEIRDDLQAVEGLLRRLNGLRTPEGEPIHASARIGGRPTWSWHQYELWWSWLRPYVRFAPAIAALRRHGAAVELDASAAELRPLLAAHGLVPEPPRPADRWSLVSRAVAAFTAAACVLRARLLGADTLVATRDQFDPKHGCDGRFREVYAALAEARRPFAEAFIARPGRGMLSKLWARRRPALYVFFSARERALERHAYSAVDVSSLELSPLFARRLLAFVAGRVQDSRGRYARLKLALRWGGFKTLIAFDDPWNGNELLAAAKDCGMRAVGIQHGMLGRYHAGWMNPGIPPEHGLSYEPYLVWSGYWKSAVERHSTQYGAGRVSVGGPLHLVPSDWSSAPTGGKCVLVPYEALASHREIADHLARLRRAGVELIFKARRDVPLARQLKEYGLDSSVRTVFDITSSVLADVAVAAGVYTTVLWDLIRAGRPVAVLETSFPYGHLLLDDRLAVPFRRDDPPERLLQVRPVPGARERLAENEPRLRETLRQLLTEEVA